MVIKKALSFSKIINMAEQEGNIKINKIVKKTRKERKIIFNVYTIHSSLNDTIILSLHLFILFSN